MWYLRPKNIFFQFWARPLLAQVWLPRVPLYITNTPPQKWTTKNYIICLILYSPRICLKYHQIANLVEKIKKNSWNLAPVAPMPQKITGAKHPWHLSLRRPCNSGQNNFLQTNKFLANISFTNFIVSFRYHIGVNEWTYHIIWSWNYYWIGYFSHRSLLF